MLTRDKITKSKNIQLDNLVEAINSKGEFIGLGSRLTQQKIDKRIPYLSRLKQGSVISGVKVTRERELSVMRRTKTGGGSSMFSNLGAGSIHCQTEVSMSRKEKRCLTGENARSPKSKMSKFVSF